MHYDASDLGSLIGSLIAIHITPKERTLIFKLVISHFRYIKYYNMAPRLTQLTSIFGVVLFLTKSLFRNGETKETSKKLQL